MPMRSARAALLALLSIALAGTLAGSLGHDAAAAEREVNVYSYRQPYLIDPLFKKFTEETGIKVNVIYAEKGLIERMAAEGRNSPADVLLTTDVGNLTQAKDAGIGQSPNSKELGDEIPAAYRDKDGIWWGLTRRARVVKDLGGPLTFLLVIPCLFTLLFLIFLSSGFASPFPGLSFP